jgi:predicted phosphate transport protein (TIGR00153 family)
VRLSTLKVLRTKIFGGLQRGEKEILDGLTEHVQLSIEATGRLRRLVSFVTKSEWSHAKETYEEIDKLESEADDLHRRLVERLSSGVFFAGLGTDLMGLAEKIDGIADSAKDAAKVLVMRRIDGAELIGLEGDIDDFLGKCESAAVELRESVMSIGKGKKEVLAHVRETERFEELADEVKNSLMEKVYQLEIPVLSIIQLKDFILQADNIGDYSEDGGDVMYVLVSKGYS